MTEAADHPAPRILLVIGIHQEELGFGQAVAARLGKTGAGAAVDVLDIPEGLPGRHPRADERDRHRLVHERLYEQLLAHIKPHHTLLIDLHAGRDDHGPAFDFYHASPALHDGLLEILAGYSDLAGVDIRLVSLSHEGPCQASTVIPPAIWNNPAFAYLGLEVYLPPNCSAHPEAVHLTSHLIEAIASVCPRRLVARFEP